MSELKWNPRSTRIAMGTLLLFCVLLIFNLYEYSLYAHQFGDYSLGEAWTLTLNDTNFIYYILPFMMLFLFTNIFRFESDFSMRLVRYSTRGAWQISRSLSRITYLLFVAMTFALLVQISFIPFTSFKVNMMSEALNEFLLQWVNSIDSMNSLKSQNTFILGIKSLFLYTLLMLLYFTMFDLFQLIYGKWKYFPSVSVLFIHAISVLVQRSNPYQLLPTPILLAMSTAPLGISFRDRVLWLIFLVMLSEIFIRLVLLKKDIS